MRSNVWSQEHLRGVVAIDLPEDKGKGVALLVKVVPGSYVLARRVPQDYPFPGDKAEPNADRDVVDRLDELTEDDLIGAAADLGALLFHFIRSERGKLLCKGTFALQIAMTMIDKIDRAELGEKT